MRVFKICRFFLACLFISTTFVLAVQIGSESCVPVSPTFISLEPYAFFPASDTDNKMLSFGFFKNGFGFEDATTSCTFSSVFPVSGPISLHGGKLYLDTDLICQNRTNLATPGLIYGQQHALDICQSVTGIPTTFPVGFDNTIIYLNGDLNVSGTMKFTGNCTIDGRWSGLDLGPNVDIIVGHDSSLELRNIALSGMSGYKIRCLDDSGTLLLNNVQWGLDDDYTFTMGSISFFNTVNVVGQNIFSYASALTATINTNALLHFSTNSIFSLGRKTGFRGREPLEFVDNTSMLGLENCTLNVTSSGIRLTKGLVILNGEVALDLDSTTSLGGLYIGNGIAQDDIMLELSSGAAVNLGNGHFIHDNAGSPHFLSSNINKSFIRQNTNTFFHTNKSLVLSNINIINATNGQTILGPNATLYFDDCLLNTSIGDFRVTATRVSDSVYLLPGNGNVTIDTGLFPVALSVKSTGNSLLGLGDMVGPIFLQDGGSQLFMQLAGVMFGNISSAGSSIMLLRDLTLTKDVVITGSANVNLLTNNLTVHLQDKVWTSTIAWNGIGGTLNLVSNFSLASQMAFQGDCTIQGNGNTLEVVSGGNILVGPNSTLRFKNIRVTGLSGNKIRCTDSSSRIVFDRVRSVLDGNYTFTTGSILFSDVVLFEGPYTWSYQSNVTSTIDQNATVRFDMGMTFSYDPVNQRQDLINFDTPSSTVLFSSNTSLYIGSGGLLLTTGQAVFNNYVSIIMGQNSLGLYIGNNVSEDDFIVNITSSSVVDVLNGSLVYQNVNSSSLNMSTVNSVIRMEPGSELNLNQNMPVGRGRVQVSSGTLLTFAPETTIVGSMEFF